MRVLVLLFPHLSDEFYRMDDIREWLKGTQNYDAGARLYLVHGTDHALRRVFSEPASDFKKKKLVEALKALVTKKAAVVKVIETTKAVAIEHIAISDRKWPEKLDPTLKALKAKWLPLFTEMMNLSSRIFDVAVMGQSDPYHKIQAGQMAHRICDLDDECDAIYTKRDHYQKYKKLPEDKGPIELVVDSKKIPLALSNARRYIRDYKNILSKEPGNVKAAEKLKQYEWAKAEYEKQLNLD